MIKYNILMCCYDKILVNVAAFVIPGKVRVVRRSGVNVKEISVCLYVCSF